MRSATRGNGDSSGTTRASTPCFANVAASSSRSTRTSRALPRAPGRVRIGDATRRPCADERRTRRPSPASATLGFSGQGQIGLAESRTVSSELPARSRLSRSTRREVALLHQHRSRPGLVGRRELLLRIVMVRERARRRRRGTSSERRRREDVARRSWYEPVTARTPGSDGASARPRRPRSPSAGRSPPPGHARSGRPRSTGPADDRNRGR